MFKSVFAKIVTAVMIIFAIGSLILLIVLSSIMSNSLAETKATNMNEVASAVADYVEGSCTELSPSAYANELNGRVLSFKELFAALLVTDSDMNILLTDASGNVLYRMVGGEVLPVNAVALPSTLLENGEIFGNGICRIVEINELFESDVLMFARALRNGSGETIGFAAVTSALAPNGRMLGDMTRTAISSTLLVLLAVMIAVYFISERITSPLREMRSAAKSFAGGQFDARVRVQGKDEVAELAVAFNHMADSLENLEKMRNSFIANVSHDLRTPMTTIAGFIDGIRDGVIPPEERDHYLEVVSKEVHRLSRLVSSLLDLSRIQAGDRKFKPAPFDICEMARLILISFEAEIEKKSLNVEFDCERDRITVLADRDAIYQVFYNICHNAVKFSRDGGTLRIRICDVEKRVSVSVYNEGQGIPQEDLPYVFERFYKSDKSRGLDKTGVGLGLFISKTIVEAHGERLCVESKSGENCEFSFTLRRASHHT